jgi:hypothetical protein
MVKAEGFISARAIATTTAAATAPTQQINPYFAANLAAATAKHNLMHSPWLVLSGLCLASEHGQ